ncbi:MAG TPA: TIGR01459 family HAD-type hydrolase [Alphaproteobacteria bacterium]|nr:TIGR01459 family HAD-type hydrolase [Alphaproteobacteria bacterium]
MSASRPIEFLPGVAALAERYDGFVLDLWGVVHDGITAYPGAADTLGRLQRAGKRAVLLSNAPRRAAEVVLAMERMGIPRDLYAAIVSSGEAAHAALAARTMTAATDPWLAALGRRCYLMGPRRDHGMLDGIAVERTAEIAEADFILATGVDWDDDRLDIYLPALEAGAARGLKMVCANPDLVVIRGGRRVICAGLLAQRYEALGGAVRYYGKPHAPIYGECLERLGIAERARVVAIGDSLRTDIAGASAAGIASVLVPGGIHGEELGIHHGEMPDASALEALCARAGYRPDAAIPAFLW